MIIVRQLFFPCLVIFVVAVVVVVAVVGVGVGGVCADVVVAVVRSSPKMPVFPHLLKTIL